jgi:hypothetical protein
MKIVKRLTAAIACLGLIFVFAGCAPQQPKSEKIDTSQVKDFADDAAERMLTAINEKDYVKFSVDFDKQMKDAMTEQKFNEMLGQIQTQFGDYESKELSGADKTQGYTRAFYSTKFSKSDKKATVTVVFSSSDGKMLISGFFIQ